jgi:class 3 adenylate cyclase
VTVLAIVVAAETVALVVLSVALVRARRRYQGLEDELTNPEVQAWSTGRATVKAVLATAARVREKGVGGAIRSSIEELAGWAEVEQPDLQRLAARDGTVTMFFSDIEGSTEINERLGDHAWLKALSGHDRVVRRRVDANDGHIIKSQGDGFMIAFAEPVRAVRAAVAIQRDLAGDRKLRAVPIRVRIGIHAGVAVHRDGDLFGRNVALTARVASAADGGEILVTDEVSEAVADEPGIDLLDAREVDLKGLPGSHRLHAVRWA